MCVGCYAFSAFTLFSPVNEAPQPATVPTLNAPTTVAPQVEDRLTVSEVRSSLAAMIQQIPDAPNFQILREELVAIQTQLIGVNDIDRVHDIMGDGILSLSDRILTAPNSAELIEILRQIQAAPTDVQASRTLLNGAGGSIWGWLS